MWWDSTRVGCARPSRLVSVPWDNRHEGMDIQTSTFGIRGEREGRRKKKKTSSLHFCCVFVFSCNLGTMSTSLSTLTKEELQDHMNRHLIVAARILVRGRKDVHDVSSDEKAVRRYHVTFMILRDEAGPACAALSPSEVNAAEDALKMAGKCAFAYRTRIGRARNMRVRCYCMHPAWTAGFNLGCYSVGSPVEWTIDDV